MGYTLFFGLPTLLYQCHIKIAYVSDESPWGLAVSAATVTQKSDSFQTRSTVGWDGWLNLQPQETEILTSWEDTIVDGRQEEREKKRSRLVVVRQNRGPAAILTGRRGS